MRLFFLYTFLIIGVALIFFLSWLPNPHIGVYGFLPYWLVRWVDDDANMNLRTAVPFVFLGLLSGVWLLLTRKNSRWWLAAWLGLVAVVTLAEAGQLAKPNRSFDVGDILWGGLGALIGMGLVALITLALNFRNKMINK